MARTALPGRLGERLRWRVATLAAHRDETAGARTLVLDVPAWPGHLPGQHMDVRLTAEDGYSTQRGYSLASAPGAERIELTVQQVDGGEVSPYLVAGMALGDQVEVRGPVGGWFVWRPESTEPVLLVGGGVGLVPLMSMIRTRRAEGSAAPFRLVYSVRAPADRLYLPELLDGTGTPTAVVHTRSAPEGSARPPSRLRAEDLTVHGWPAEQAPTCYVCGPTGFVEHAAGRLVALGHAPERIRTERFGPTGG